MAIVFTELVKKGTNSGSTGGDDKYLNMIKMMTGQMYAAASGMEYLPYSLEITPDLFDPNMDVAILDFSSNEYLTSVEAPENIKDFVLDFAHCRNLTSVSLLGYESDGTIEGNIFRWCTNLKTLNLPKFRGKLAYSFVSDANGYNKIEKLVIPQVYEITSGAFNDAQNLKLIDFRGRASSEIPSLSDGCFYMGSGVNCTMVIPDNLYDTWTHSGAWYTLYSSSNYHFVKESEYVEQ